MPHSLIAACAIQLITASASEKHSNEMPFEGVLVRLDEPSTKAPNGSRGHRIQIPSSVAQEHLKTLIGMGINYSDSLDKHQPTHKVGVIKRAWIDGKDLKVSGVIWKKDFPEAEKDLSKKNLGMSFEADQIEVEDIDASIWMISHLCFTGATILYKNAAAYYNTSAEALAAAAATVMVLNSTNDGGRKMSQGTKNKENKKTVAASGAPDLTFLTEGMKSVLAAMQSQTEATKALAAEIRASRGTSEEKEEDDKEVTASMEDEDVDASKHKKEDDEDEEDDDEDEEDDEEDDDVDAACKAEEKDKEKEDKGDKMAANANTDIASLISRIEKLEASKEMISQERDSYKKKYEATQAKLEAAASAQERRSVPVTSTLLSQTLAKANVDVAAISASGTKISVSEMDQILASSQITGVQAMAFKNEAVRAGLMDDGSIVRS